MSSQKPVTDSTVILRQESVPNYQRRRRGRRSDIRRVPTWEEKIEAIYDYWKFIDILSFQGGSHNFGDCHRELVAWSENHGALKELILMPRGHLKSTLMTVGKTLHRIYQNPNIRIFVGTATKELATSFVREVKTYLEDQWLQDHIWNDRPHILGRLIPTMDRVGRQRRRDIYFDIDVDETGTQTEAEDKKIVWRGTAIQVLRDQILKEPTVTVGAVGVQPTGFHFDELKLDDVVNYDNVTEKGRDKVVSWVNDLISVLDDPFIDADLEDQLREIKNLPGGIAEQLSIVGGKITACGTRYDRDDWYGGIIQGIFENTSKWAAYQRNIYKDGHTRESGYLWHERWNIDVEMDKRSELTAVRFASQYLNEIVAAEEQILNPDRIKYFAPFQVKLLDTGMVEIRLSDDDVALIHPIIVVDPAAAVGEKADFTAVICGGRDKHGRVFVLDGAVGRWKSEESLKIIFKFADKWKRRRVFVEAVGGFKHYSEYIRSSFDRFRPISVQDFKPQGKKEVRIANALEPLFTNGMIYFASYIIGNSDEIRDQLLLFPRPTIHDDFPDALAAMAEISKPPKQRPVNKLRKQINNRYGGIRG